jgi:hypothetical protein
MGSRPYSYTNRRGDTYFLHTVVRKNGKTAYAMKRKLGDGALDDLPDGYEVAESINGAVSVRRPPKRVITEAEEGL